MKLFDDVELPGGSTLLARTGTTPTKSPVKAWYSRAATSFCCTVALLSIFSHAKAANYTFNDLGTLGGLYSFGYTVNNSGLVVGHSYMPGNGSGNAFLWDGSSQVGLGTLGGSNSVAYGINDRNQVVGYSDATGNSASHATLWNGSTATDLGTLGGNYSWASAINNNGLVVGSSTSDSSGVNHAAIWSGTSPTDLGSLGGANGAGAIGINSAGHVVGYSYIVGDTLATHAVLWRGAGTEDLATLGGLNSGANGINDVGQIVGYSDLAGNTGTHATLWNGATTLDLGALNGGSSFATAINSSGQVVGFSYAIPGSAHFSTATLWNGGHTTDLNSFLEASAIDAGWYLYDARGINDRGWISGTAVNSVTGQSHAYLLTVSAVPEPSSGAMFLCGLGVAAWVGRRRRGLPGCFRKQTGVLHTESNCTGTEAAH